MRAVGIQYPIEDKATVSRVGHGTRIATSNGIGNMSVINLTNDEKRKVRRIILFRPKPAKIHRKAVILYQLARWDDVAKIVRTSGLKPEAIASVLAEFQSRGLDATIAVSDAATEHRKRLEDVEKRAPSREKFREMMERFPAPDRWLDDNDDWDL